MSRLLHRSGCTSMQFGSVERRRRGHRRCDRTLGVAHSYPSSELSDSSAPALANADRCKIIKLERTPSTSDSCKSDASGFWTFWTFWTSWTLSSPSAFILIRTCHTFCKSLQRIMCHPHPSFQPDHLRPKVLECHLLAPTIYYQAFHWMQALRAHRRAVFAGLALPI